MQEWVDSQDGKGSVLMLTCCNPNDFNLTSKKSLLIYFKDITSLYKASLGGHLKLYIPEIGYFDKNYKNLRKAINSLHEYDTEVPQQHVYPK